MKPPIIRLDSVDAQIDLIRQLYDMGYRYGDVSIYMLVDMWNELEFYPYIMISPQDGEIDACGDSAYQTTFGQTTILVNSPAQFVSYLKRTQLQAPNEISVPVDQEINL